MCVCVSMYVCILMSVHLQKTLLQLIVTNFKIKVYNKRGLGNGLTVKHVYCSCRGSEFGFKHSLLVGSQQPVIGDPIPLDSMETCIHVRVLSLSLIFLSA